MTADCIVLGGGVIGRAIALRLRARGAGVVLVERGLPGAASTAAAGILAPEVEAGGPGALFTLGQRSRAGYAALADELGAIGLAGCGALMVAHDPGERAALAARRDWLVAAGAACQWLDGRAARGAAPALGAVVAALHIGAAAQVDPPRLHQALAAAGARAGVREVTASARELLCAGGRVAGVRLDGGRLDGGAVVVALGAWSAQLAGVAWAEAAVRPLRGQMIELRPPAPPLDAMVFGDGGYLVPRGDGRVHVGSTEEWAGYDAATTPEGQARLAARAARLCPALAAAPVVRAWAGLRPATVDGMPLVGATPLGGLFLATGHHRHGILLAPLTADAIAAAVAGAPPDPSLAALDPRRALG